MDWNRDSKMDTAREALFLSDPPWPRTKRGVDFSTTGEITTRIASVFPPCGLGNKLWIGASPNFHW